MPPTFELDTTVERADAILGGMTDVYATGAAVPEGDGMALCATDPALVIGTEVRWETPEVDLRAKLNLDLERLDGFISSASSTTEDVLRFEGGDKGKLHARSGGLSAELRTLSEQAVKNDPVNQRPSTILDNFEVNTVLTTSPYTLKDAVGAVHGIVGGDKEMTWVKLEPRDEVAVVTMEENDRAEMPLAGEYEAVGSSGSYTLAGVSLVEDVVDSIPDVIEEVTIAFGQDTPVVLWSQGEDVSFYGMVAPRQE